LERSTPFEINLERQDSDSTALTWVRRVEWFFRDLPTMSRYVGHIALALLIYVIASDVVPSGLHGPSRGYVAAARSAAISGHDLATEEANAEMLASFDDGAEERYLERSSAPFTVRVLRDIIPSAVAEPQRAVRTSVTTYKVQPGDTVLGIAEKFGLKGSSLLWANEKLDSNPDVLQVGQELNILPVDGAYHTVAKGDTVESIASKYKVDPSVIISYGGNKLTASSKLEVGQKIIVPGGVKPYVAKRVVAYAGTIPTDAKKGTGGLVWPMSGSISQKAWAGHMAIDIAAPKGTPIYASDSGFVIQAGYTTVGYGNMVVVDHGNGYQTLYAHMNKIYVEVGQSVAKGELVGECGATGRATGYHLHFEVIKDGVRRNPMSYLP